MKISSECNETEKIIGEKLDLLIRLTTLSIVKDKDYQDQVLILSSIGFKPKESAIIFGKTENNVSATLSRIRKKKRKRKT